MVIRNHDYPVFSICLKMRHMNALFRTSDFWPLRWVRIGWEQETTIKSLQNRNSTMKINENLGQFHPFKSNKSKEWIMKKLIKWSKRVAPAPRSVSRSHWEHNQLCVSLRICTPGDIVKMSLANGVKLANPIFFSFDSSYSRLDWIITDFRPKTKQHIRTIMFVRATQRNRVTTSVFSTTFAICFLLVGANSVLPCPVDSVHGNDSVVDERLSRQEKKAQKENV